MERVLHIYGQEGFDNLDTEKELKIAEYIEKEQTSIPVPLYRGIKTEDDFQVGEVVAFENCFASFDENEETAREFAGERGVLFVIEEGKGMPLYEYISTCFGESEWLILDAEFEVTEVEYEEDGLTIVSIRIKK